jgi:hypothetical protein
MHGSLVTRVTTICVGVDRGSYALLLLLARSPAVTQITDEV